MDGDAAPCGEGRCPARHRDRHVHLHGLALRRPVGSHRRGRLQGICGGHPCRGRSEARGCHLPPTRKRKKVGQTENSEILSQGGRHAAADCSVRKPHSPAGETGGSGRGRLCGRPFRLHCRSALPAAHRAGIHRERHALPAHVLQRQLRSVRCQLDPYPPR